MHGPRATELKRLTVSSDLTVLAGARQSLALHTSAWPLRLWTAILPDGSSLVPNYSALCMLLPDQLVNPELPRGAQVPGRAWRSTRDAPRS